MFYKNNIYIYIYIYIYKYNFEEIYLKIIITNKKKTHYEKIATELEFNHILQIIFFLIKV